MRTRLKEMSLHESMDTIYTDFCERGGCALSRITRSIGGSVSRPDRGFLRNESFRRWLQRGGHYKEKEKTNIIAMTG